MFNALQWPSQVDPMITDALIRHTFSLEVASRKNLKHLRGFRWRPSLIKCERSPAWWNSRKTSPKASRTSSVHGQRYFGEKSKPMWRIQKFNLTWSLFLYKRVNLTRKIAQNFWPNDSWMTITFQAKISSRQNPSPLRINSLHRRWRLLASPSGTGTRRNSWTSKPRSNNIKIN